MDTQAYLLKHGWRGTGHSLDTTNKGLRKPLLISKKVDVLGVGINKHDVISDQWWLKAFDSSLKDFGTGKKSLLGNVREHGVNRGGLYARFVQGESEGGTLGQETKGAKRKVGEVEEVDTEGKSSKKSKSGKKEKAKKRSTTTTTTSTETSDFEPKKKKGSKKDKTKKEKTLDALPEDKKAQYASRAAAKNLTLEEYFSQRQVKNLEAKTSRRQTPVSDSAAVGGPAPPSTKTKKSSQRKEKKSSSAADDDDDDDTVEKTTAKAEKTSKAGNPSHKPDDQKALADEILYIARRKLNGETVNGEAKGTPSDVVVTSKKGGFTEGEVAAAMKAAKRVIKEKKNKNKKKDGKKV